MTMTPEEEQRIVDQLLQTAAARNCTVEQHREQESKDNVVCHKKLAPATDHKYARAEMFWGL